MENFKMPTFIENIRAVNDVFPHILSALQGRSAQGEAALPNGRIAYKNLPSTHENENSEDWTERIAVPFSITKNGNKKYGMIYMPESEAARTLDPSRTQSSDGFAPGSGNIQIYGGETMDGLSFSPSGFNKIIEESDKDSFRIENGLRFGLDTTTARLYDNKSGRRTDRSVSHIPGVKVSNTQSMKELRKNLLSAQANNFIDNFRINNMNK